MGELLLRVLPLAIGAACSPTTLIANLLVLSLPEHHRIRSLLFVLGNVVVLAAFTTIVFVGLIPAVSLGPSGADPADATFDLVAAALLVLLAVRAGTRLVFGGRIAHRLLGDRVWDIVVAHDVKTLDAALALHPAHGVVLDLHEYAPRQEEHDPLWRRLFAPYIRWMCRTVVPRTAAVVTVSRGIAEEYEEVFGIQSTLVVNATPYAELGAQPVGSPLRLVHSGGVARQRRLDIMIDGVRRSSADVTLDLFLVDGDDAVLRELHELAAGDDRVRFRDPVPYADLIRTLNGYDLGLSIFPPTTFNLAWCLPNKFFDYVQARLGVIVGPSPEMSRVVAEHGLGLVLEDFEAPTLAAALEALTAGQVAGFKAGADAAAAPLASERQAEIWLGLVDRVVAA